MNDITIEISKINEYRFNINRSNYHIATIDVCIDGVHFNTVKGVNINIPATEMIMIANKMEYLTQTCWLKSITEKLKKYDYYVEYDPIFEQYNILHKHDMVFETFNSTRIFEYIRDELKIDLNKINIKK